MVKLRQADIFDKEFYRNETLIIVFGHIGFNEMGASWRSFSSRHEELNNINNPFQSIPNKPIRLKKSCWLWFVPEGDNHGMETGELEKVLDNIFVWVGENLISNVITNGISNIDYTTNTVNNRLSDDERARYLINYMRKIDNTLKGDVILVSRNDVFIRNGP